MRFDFDALTSRCRCLCSLAVQISSAHSILALNEERVRHRSVPARCCGASPREQPHSEARVDEGCDVFSFVLLRIDREDRDTWARSGRARHERPRGRRAANQRDELAPLHCCGHSITSSARASNVGGTSMPSALAVLRLMTSSYLVGCWIGRLAAFSSLRIRSTYAAERRTMSTVFGP